MHTSLNRLQTTFGFFTSCAFTLAAIIALLSVLPLPAPSGTPSASITVRDVQVVKGRPYRESVKKDEYAQIKFDLDVDLTSLFTWNTKQLFVYVTANYPSGVSGAVSEAVIWDLIIPATESPWSFQNLKAQYWDPRVQKTYRSKAYQAKAKKGTTAKASTKDVVKPGLLSLKKQRPKYHITDPSGKISERTNATLQVSWNVQPWVGALVWDKGYLGSRVGSWAAGKNGRSQAFDFPPLKGSSSESVKAQTPRTPVAGKVTPVVDV